MRFLTLVRFNVNLIFLAILLLVRASFSDTVPLVPSPASEQVQLLNISKALQQLTVQVQELAETPATPVAAPEAIASPAVPPSASVAAVPKESLAPAAPAPVAVTALPPTATTPVATPAPSVASGEGWRFSGDLLGIYTLPLGPTGTTNQGDFGFRVTPGVAYDFGNRILLRMYAGYERVSYESKSSVDVMYTSYKTTENITANILTFGFGTQSIFSNSLFCDVGISVDLPLSASDEATITVSPDPYHLSSTETGDFDANTALYTELSVGYMFTPSIGILVGYRFDLLPFAGDIGKSSALELHQLTFGLRYNR